MASGLPEKLSVTMLLAAIRRLQQRDCPGFSPDSLLIATHKPCLRRQEVAANQLRVQRYDKKMNKKIFFISFFSNSDKIIFLFILKSTTKPFNVLLACTHPLITELAEVSDEVRDGSSNE